MNNRLDYNDIMPFGKHKGQQVKDVLLSQPDYILWAERRTQRFAAMRSLVLRLRQGCDIGAVIG